MLELSVSYLVVLCGSLVTASMAITALLLNRRYQQQQQQRQQQYQLDEQQLQQQIQQQQAVEQQLQQQLAWQRQELDKTQQYQQQAQTLELQLTRLQERLDTQQSHTQQQLVDLQQTREALEQSRAQLGQLETQLATEKEGRLQQQQNADEKLRLLEDNKAQLLKEFELLSQRVLEEKARQFSEQNKQQTEQHKQGLDALLAPFKQQLEGLHKKVEDVHLHDAKDRASLRAQIGELHKLNQQITSEAQALTTALRGEQKVQGNWGEMVLETVLERSGLRAGEEYVREQSHSDDSGQRYRPDVIINLPEGKHIVVDSKVSLNAYTDSINADTDDQRQAALKRHVDSVRAHIKGLSEKAYQQLEGLNSPDFVFLFMPVEPAFMAAFQQDEQLFNDAFERRIVVVTPTTLLATLRTVASLWAIERRNRNTEKIADQARLVYEKVVSLVDYMEKLGKQINTVQGTYEDAWKSLKHGRGNLLSRADNFQKLGVRVKKELARNLVEEANAEDELHRALQQPESADDSATSKAAEQREIEL